MERRLAAILAADVVGYSKLMSADEAGTLAALKAHRAEVFDPATARHNGRIVKLMGDGVLVEFASVVDAVQCAIAVQTAPKESGDESIRLRIGVNLGDVIIDGDDIYGDGVNIAARLEAMAESGGICISSIVRESLGNRIEADFLDTGPHEFKNIPNPVRVFRWTAQGAETPTAIEAQAQHSKKPTVAILPFDNMSGDNEQAYFADGITEDIITELSRYGEFLVLARNSTFAFKGRTDSVRRIGKELGADYVVEGSVRRSGSRVRVSAQLIDCRTDGHIWAERFDRELTDIFAVQDEITRAIASALGSVVSEAETRRAMSKLPSNMAAYDQFLRAWQIGLEITREAQQTAMREAEKAIELDPVYARPYGALALFLCSAAWNGWAEDVDAAVIKGRDYARKAVAIDPYDPWAHAFLGIAELWRRDYDRAIAETSKAVELNPNFADGYAWHASVLVFSGEAARGLDNIAAARRLNPRSPIWYSLIEARGHFSREDFAQALRAVNDVLAEKPHFTAALGIAAASYAAIGNHEEARGLVERVRDSAPNYRLSVAKSLLPYKEPADLDRFLRYAGEAGLPE